MTTAMTTAEAQLELDVIRSLVDRARRDNIPIEERDGVRRAFYTHDLEPADRPIAERRRLVIPRGCLEPLGPGDPVVPGLGRDAPTETNRAGGTQSRVPASFHLCDWPALFRLGARMQDGAQKYSRDNWRKIPIEDHLNHAVCHIGAYLAGDLSDDHLDGAFARVMMALALHLSSGPLRAEDGR